MDKWLNSLSNKELKTWIKNMDNPLGQFLASDEDIKNLETAKNIFNKRIATTTNNGVKNGKYERAR